MRDYERLSFRDHDLRADERLNAHFLGNVGQAVASRLGICRLAHILDIITTAGRIVEVAALVGSLHC